MFYVEYLNQLDARVHVLLDDLTLEEARTVAHNGRALGFAGITIKHEEGTATVR